MSRPHKYDRTRVAELVLEAMLLDLPLAVTLGQLMEVPRARAEYMIRAVREDGSLGRGRHRPARAVIHRGTSRERRWIVCETCTTQWPCTEAGLPLGMDAPTASEGRAR